MRRTHVMETEEPREGASRAPGRALARATGLLMSLALLALAGCNPTVRVAPPEEPIVIHMNVKIEHEIRVKVDEDLEEAFEDNPEIF